MFQLAWFKKHWIILPLALSNCTHAPSAPVPVPENKDGSLQFIVSEGQSSQAVYSTDGNKILFVSRGRANKRDQVYEKDLKSGVEKRITFQNGVTYQPRYLSKPGWIAYASSTDELEEDPALLKPTSDSPSKLPFPYQEQMEIYAHSLNGFEIVRLTNHPGFDGEVHLMGDGNNLFFTRVSNLRTHIMIVNRNNRMTREISGLGSNPTLYSATMDGKLKAWIDWDEAFGVSRLLVQRGKEKPVEVNPDQIVVKTDLSFSPDFKWLLWAQKESQKSIYDIWVLDTSTMCASRMTKSSSGERRDPTLSPDLRWLTFTVREGDRSRIARMGFTPPTGPCTQAP